MAQKQTNIRRKVNRATYSKIFVLIISALLVFCLASCSDPAGKTAKSTTNTPPKTTSAAATASAQANATSTAAATSPGKLQIMLADGTVILTNAAIASATRVTEKSEYKGETMTMNSIEIVFTKAGEQLFTQASQMAAAGVRKSNLIHMDKDGAILKKGAPGYASASLARDARHEGNRVTRHSIVTALNGHILSIAEISSAITSSEIVILGNFSKKEAQKIASEIAG